MEYFQDVKESDQPDQSDQSEQSKQSSEDVKYTSSFACDTYKFSKKLKDTPLDNIITDLNDTSNTDNKLFTPIKKGTGIQILTPKQLLQRLPLALAQVKASNNSESLLNEIRHIVYSLYQSKKVTKKVYNNIINSIQILKMDTIFMKSENSKTAKPHILILKLTDKLDLRRGEKSIALSNLSIYYTWENIKSLHNNYKFKISAPTWNDKFELHDESYSVSDIQNYFEYILKKRGENTDIHQY